MVWPILGALIGGATSLIGGAMQSGAQRDANNANIAAQEAANEKNYQAQKEFAQQGLRWKVEDAKASGLHPLYALGAPTTSFQASYGAAMRQPETGIGEGLVQSGQDIGRAVAATQTNQERAYTAAMSSLSLERATLENDLLRTQIRRQVMETGPSFARAEADDGALETLKHLFGDVPLGPHASASDVQNEYGEVVGDVHGIGRWISDMSSAASQYLANPPNNRPGRRPGEPTRPGPGAFAPQLGKGYNRPRRASGSW